MLEPGAQLGEYVIESELGAGGMAHVFKARHAILDTHHAIKVLLPKHREDPEVRKRFLDEARIQAKHLVHPNIVKVTNIVSTSEHAALVMELVEGRSLEDELPSLKARPDEVVRIMLAVLDAVGYAHQRNIIHRDLKPANVLLDGSVPKVTDFGIAKLGAPEGPTKIKSTHADARMGTLNYMSPEQIRRAKDVTPRSDIFSLGAMLYEMATGRLAFNGEDDFAVMENIVHGRYKKPEGVEPRIARVIEKALAAAPEDRYASCEEMAKELRPPLSNVVGPVRPPVEPTAPAKHSKLIGIGLIGLALAVAGVGIAMVMKKDSAPVASGVAPVAVADASVAVVVDAAVVEDAAVPVDAKPEGGPGTGMGMGVRPPPAPPKKKLPPKDSDGDGTFDFEDRCPQVPGQVVHSECYGMRPGCPVGVDSDGDRVPDDIDKCPSVKGEVMCGARNGCVLVDTDGDGVDDADDQCAGAAETRNGLKDRDGCPD